MEEWNMKRSCGRAWQCASVVALIAPAVVSAQTASPTIVKELVASWQRAATTSSTSRRQCPRTSTATKPTPEIATFRDQLVHVSGIAQRFHRYGQGVKSEAAHAHGEMKKAEVIALLKKTLQSGQETLGSLTDAQLLEQVKFPFGDRMVTRFTFWMGPSTSSAITTDSSSSTCA